MTLITRCLLATILASVSFAASAKSPILLSYPEVKITTNKGSFVVQLNRNRAPRTVSNFLKYVHSGFYNGTIFHRVIPGFVIQGGGYTAKYKEKKTYAPIPNESGNGLSNMRGTIAMARENAPHTATSQFYINLADNTNLDPQPSRWGYAVFGEVVKGMKVVEAIAKIPTGPAGPFPSDVPQFPVIIEKATVLPPGAGN